MADKYGAIMPEAAERIMAEEAARHANPKAARKAAHKALHGMSEAYFSQSDVKRARKALDANDTIGVLQSHASTKERLPYYAALFAAAERFIQGDVLDVACGLNPVAFGSRGYAVTGLDIHMGCVEIINAFAIRAGACIGARAWDAAVGTPPDTADTALIFKLLPLLERRMKGASAALLDGLNVNRAIVSYPAATMSGRNVGMKAHYTAMMEALLPARYAVECVLDTRGELFFFLKAR